MINNSHPIQSLLFLIISSSLFIIRNSYDPLFIYFLLNISLLLYVTFILNRLWKKYKTNFFFNPLVISLIVNFLFFSGGLTYFFLYENYNPITEVNSEIYLNSIYYAESGFLINISSVLVVFGFNTKIASNINKYILRKSAFFSYNDLNIKPRLLLLLILLTYYSKLLLFLNNLFGRIGVYDSNISSILSISSKLGLFTILVSSYHYFKYGRNRFLFYTCLILEVFFSFLSASRSPMISLFLLIFIIHIYVNKKINIKPVVYGLLVFIFSFTTITDFKRYVEEGNVTSTSINTIFINYYNNFKQFDFSFEKFKLDSFGRLNYVSEMASAIQYKKEVGLSKGDPDFLKALSLVPIQVFLPNSLIGIKNYSYGDWFRYQVLNRGSTTQLYNISFSPLAFLFFSGGYFFVFIGFFFYGILLKSIDNLHSLGFTGLVFFFLLGSTLLQFKTNIPANLVDYFRLIILVPLIFKFLKFFRLFK